MRLIKLKLKKASVIRVLMFVGVVLVFAGSGVAMALTFPHSQASQIDSNVYPLELRLQYAALVKDVHAFEDSQSKSHVTLIGDLELQQQLSSIQLDASTGQIHAAMQDIKTVRKSLEQWKAQLSTIVASQNAAAAAPAKVAATPRVAPTSFFIPILLYHYTPANFEQQLVYLEQHSYTVVSLDAAVRGMNGGTLPPKPVVITFDDGFANQMQAFELLKKHGMHATFYIINGGAESRWCLGAGRRYGDPLQPAGGCGDSYLSWDQVRLLDQSGIVTIGAHTLDHENLATLSEAAQRVQIFDSKAGVESQLGHAVYDFAYPYGGYTQTTINLVREAGFINATTTLPGSYQTPGSDFTLHRIRDTLTLP